MKVIKKYTAIQLDTKKVNNDIEIELSYGSIDGDSDIEGIFEFETPQDAYSAAFDYILNKLNI